MKILRVGKVEITRLKPAGFRIKGDDLVIYFDPYKETDGKADVILISHDHFDHFDLSTINLLEKPSTQIIGPEVLINKITSNFHPLKPGNSTTIRGLKIETIPAYNINSHYHPKSNGYLGFIIEISGERIYFAGDTDKTTEMLSLKNIDVAMLPIGGTYTMNENEAASAAKVIKPKIVIPMHCADEIISSGDPQTFRHLADKISKVNILE